MIEPWLGLLMLWAILVVWVVIAVVFSKDPGVTSFQIHDDTPDWFLDKVNRDLDRILKHAPLS